MKQSNVIIAGREFEPRLIVTEVAQILRLEPSTVYRLAAAGEIPCIRHGRALRFLWSEIEKLEQRMSEVCNCRQAKEIRTDKLDRIVEKRQKFAPALPAPNPETMASELLDLVQRSGYTQEELYRVLRSKMILKREHKSLEQVAKHHLQMCLTQMDNLALLLAEERKRRQRQS